MNNINKEYKKSSLNIKDEMDIYQLERHSNYLLDCSIIKTEDKVSFEFMYENEKYIEEIKKMSLSNKYRALLNVQYLLEDYNRVKFSLEPTNVMCDLNLLPKIIMRDIHEGAESKNEEFLLQYKALIGYMLQDKYEFNDYYEGGMQLLAKNKLTSIYKDVSTIDELVVTLNEEYNNLQLTLEGTIIEVDKKKYNTMKVLNRVMTLLLVIVMITGIYFGYYKLNTEIIINKSNEAYIKQDYISVVDTLKDTSISEMNTNTKFILAVSIIKSESLTTEQKNNILSSITLNADERILEYWIYLGKKDTQKAIDIAKQLGNKEYLAYGYMKDKDQVEKDNTLSGAEKETRLKEIESNIKDLDIINDEVNNN